MIERIPEVTTRDEQARLLRRIRAARNAARRAGLRLALRKLPRVVRAHNFPTDEEPAP